MHCLGLRNTVNWGGRYGSESGALDSRSTSLDGTTT